MLRSCLIAGNSSETHGAVYAYQINLQARIENCTVVGNTTKDSNAGGLTLSSNDNRQRISVTNSIFAFNINRENDTKANIKVAGDFQYAGFGNCCDPLGSLSAYASAGNISETPAFVAKAIGDYRPRPWSPCVNAGTNGVWMTGAFDLSGNPRIFGGAVDIGCYELQQPPVDIGDVLHVDAYWCYPEKRAPEYFVGSYGMPGASDDNDGTSPERPFATIAKAMTKVGSGTVVQLANGVHKIDSTVAAAGHTFSLYGNCTNRTLAVIDGQGGTQVVEFRTGGNILSDVTVSNGVRTVLGAKPTAAGIVSVGRNVITNCIIADCRFLYDGVDDLQCGGGAHVSDDGVIYDTLFVDNVASNAVGGGLNIQNGTARNCDFRGNTTIGDVNHNRQAGAVFLKDSKLYDSRIVSNTFVRSSSYAGAGLTAEGKVIVSNCLIACNQNMSQGAGGVGMLSATDPDSLFCDCVISNNVSAKNGGGVGIYNGKMLRCRILENRQTETPANEAAGGAVCLNGTMEECIVSGNESPTASAVQVQGTSSLLRNCLFTGNKGAGSVVYAYQNNVAFRMENCTIAGNTVTGAFDSTGALRLVQKTQYAYVTNCIIADNTNTVAMRAAGISVNNPTDRNELDDFGYCCSPTGELEGHGIGNTSRSPKFVNASAFDFHFRYGSACRDTGLFMDWMTSATDFDGKPRVFPKNSNTPDMGCFELKYIAGTLFFVR